jgi:hypothetical protein
MYLPISARNSLKNEPLWKSPKIPKNPAIKSLKISAYSKGLSSVEEVEVEEEEEVVNLILRGSRQQDKRQSNNTTDRARRQQTCEHHGGRQVEREGGHKASQSK